MKTELRRRKLPISGTKSQLIDRLVYSDTNSSVGTQSPMPAQPAVERKQPPKSAKKSKEIDVVIPTSMTPSGKDASLANYPTAIVKPATMQSLVDDDEEDEMNAELRIWSSPLKTIWYFGAGMKDLGVDAIVYAAGHRITISLLIVASILAYAGYTTDNPYQQVFRKAESNILWYGYWVLLGVASSIGLGTGLHTFVLFLGPFIAKVAVVAQECGSLDFAVHGPNAFNCEENDYFSDISLGAIYSKVLFESFAWGAGTAIGELPPYFVARAGKRCLI